MIPAWLTALLGLLAETIAQVVRAHAAGKSADEIIALATESAAAQAVLLAEQRRVLKEAEALVPGWKAGS